MCNLCNNMWMNSQWLWVFGYLIATRIWDPSRRVWMPFLLNMKSIRLFMCSISLHTILVKSKIVEVCEGIQVFGIKFDSLRCIFLDFILINKHLYREIAAFLWDHGYSATCLKCGENGLFKVTKLQWKLKMEK